MIKFCSECTREKEKTRNKFLFFNPEVKHSYCQVQSENLQKNRFCFKQVLRLYMLEWYANNGVDIAGSTTTSSTDQTSSVTSSTMTATSTADTPMTTTGATEEFHKD